MTDVKRQILLAAISVVLVGCTPSLPERDALGGVALPSNWTAREIAAPQDVSQGWLDDFEDQRLEELASIALAKNPDLTATAARVAQSRAQARVAFAGRLPTVGVSFDASRFQTRFTGPTGQVGVVRQNTFALGGQLDWELDVWGRLAATNAAAGADLQATEADFEAARLSLVANVARSYFNLISSAQQSALAAESVATFERSYAIVTSRYRRGLTDALDVRLTSNSLESAKALEMQRQGQEDQTRRGLEVLLADYPSAALQVRSDLPGLRREMAAGLPSDLLSRRPDIQGAYLRLAAADYRVAVARRDLLPRITISGTASNQNESFTDFLDFNSLVKRFAGSIAQPLFQGGRLRATVDLNKAQAEEALAQYTGTLLTAFQEVEVALAAEDFLAKREAFLAEAAKQATAAAKLAQQQYSNGLTPILNLLDAQRRELDSRGQLIDIQLLRLQNRVDLYLALGGPIEAPLPTQEETL